MAEKSGFFNAREMEDGTYDREYGAEQFAEYFANFVSNGVYANPANQLKVVFDDSPSKPFVVIVRKGKAYIDGYWYELTEDMEITIPVNTKAYIVKDVIRCTLDKAERKISIVLEEDVKSDYPVNNKTRHDLVLSTIVVQPNASKLNVKDIADKRPDKTYCGFVTGVIDQIDTTELFQQYDDAFQIWFDEMKDQLSTDAAGNLQTQIDDLEQKNNDTENRIETLKNDYSVFKREELTKTIVVTKTVTETGGAYMSMSLPFPTGFNQDNCYIKSIFARKIEGEGVGVAGYDYYGYNAQNLISIGGTLKNDIYVILTSMSTLGTFKGRYKVRVVLEKI